MTDKKQSEAAWRVGLAQRAQQALSAQTTRHMTPAPTGANVSLAEMVGDDEYGTAPNTPVAQASPVQHAGQSVEATVVVPEGQIIKPIGIHLIIDSDWQPRIGYDESGLAELATSLQLNGQDEPIQVVKLPNGKYRLVSGHRRTRAARLAGWAEIKAVILELDERGEKLATLRANAGRDDLSAFEWGRTFQIALDEGFATTQKEVAALFGTTQGRVSQCMTVYSLSPAFLEFQTKHPKLLHYRSARAIQGLMKKFPDSEEKLLEVAERLIDEPDMDVSEFVEIAMRKLQMKPEVVRSKDPRIFRDLGGNETFSLKATGTKLVVDVKGGFDPEIVSQHLATLLERLGTELKATEAQVAQDAAKSEAV
jgi:ParB/RepB/Spo0J family partition protein